MIEVHEIEFESHGLWADHSMPCPIFHSSKSVYHMDSGIFQPSRRAQNIGWVTVRAGYVQKFIMRIIGVDFSQ
jgi:hypothetical protein